MTTSAVALRATKKQYATPFFTILTGCDRLKIGREAVGVINDITYTKACKFKSFKQIFKISLETYPYNHPSTKLCRNLSICEKLRQHSKCQVTFLKLLVAQKYRIEMIQIDNLIIRLFKSVCQCQQTSNKKKTSIEESKILMRPTEKALPVVWQRRLTVPVWFLIVTKRSPTSIFSFFCF